MRLFSILFSFLVLSSMLGAYGQGEPATLPVYVDILNAPPQIVSVTMPDYVPPRTLVSIIVRVRDNNTLNDISVAWGFASVPNDQNVTPSITNTSPDYTTGDYTFSFVSPWSGGLSGQIAIGDEELVQYIPIEIPIEAKKNLTLVTPRIDLSISPGSTKSTTFTIRLDTNTNTTLFARIAENSGIQARINGIPVQGTSTKIKNYPAMEGEDILTLSVSVPSVYPDAPDRVFKLILSLGEQEVTAEIEISRIPWVLVGAVALFALLLVGAFFLGRRKVGQ